MWQAGSNKSSIGKARGNSGDLNGGGFGGGGSGSGSGSGRLGDDGNYGLTDYRLIPRWHFVTQPFLEQEDKANMTIGILVARTGVVGESKVAPANEDHQGRCVAEGGSVGLGPLFPRRPAWPLPGQDRRGDALSRDELNSSPYSPSEVGSSVAGGEGEKRDFTPGSFKLPKKSLPSIAKRFTITAPAEHSHASAEEASVCVTCIDIRRKMFGEVRHGAVCYGGGDVVGWGGVGWGGVGWRGVGCGVVWCGEVRLLMWFQFDEFAETCSHLWPEEPLQPEKMHFSPNQLYRKGMLFWEMFLPYLNFMREADAIMCWGRPWRSGVLGARYYAICGGGGGGGGGGMGTERGKSTEESKKTSTQRRQMVGSSTFFYTQKGRNNREKNFALAWARLGLASLLVRSAPNRDRRNHPDSYPDPPKSRCRHASLSLRTINKSAICRFISPVESVTSSTPANVYPFLFFFQPAGATGSSGVGFDSGVPSLLNSPTLDRTNSNGSAVSRLSKDVSVTVARGGVAVADAAGAGKKKIKKLMPSRVTKDPEMDELNSRLGNTKKVPLVINEVGKRLLGKSGPGMQRQVEKLGMNLIKIRTWFHPLHAKHLVGMVSAITAHMLLQMWLYHAGR
eukprot:jgi/Undpi1/2198/HiC_scaffold_12.g05584.m1